MENHDYTRIWKDIGIEEKDCVAHYSKLKHVANILNDKRLLIGSVCNFGDPRESYMGWLDSLGYGWELDRNNEKKAKEIIRKAGRQIRILCTVAHQMQKPSSELSSHIENVIYGRPRMWDQYGDHARGFSIVLDKKALQDELQKVAEKEKYLISGRVEYLDWLDKIIGDGVMIEHSPGKDLSNLDIFEKMNENCKLKNLYFRKSIDWEGENEYRWLLFAPTEDPIFVSIKNSIKAVVLGANFPDNQFSQVKVYCQELGIPCYYLDFKHPKYRLGKYC